MQWESLINAIPEIWTATLLDGNQDFKDGEYLALPINGEISDVYRWKDNKLLYLDWHPELESIAIPTIRSGTPGEGVGDDEVYPNSNELKRIRTDKYDEEGVMVISWLLPDYKKDKPHNEGIAKKSFKHQAPGTRPQLGSTPPGDHQFFKKSIF